MNDFILTQNDITNGINAIILKARLSSPSSRNPRIVFITGGPGSGKSAIEFYYNELFKNYGEKAFSISSDIIATFHPDYDEALQLLPEECYRVTRQFVRPATPVIFHELIKNNINLINENTLDKGEPDLELVRKLKNANYGIVVTIMATDLFESRLSCYERESGMIKLNMVPRGCSKETQLRMYDSFIPTIRQLQKEGMINNLLIYTRAQSLQEPPILIYQSSKMMYKDIDFEVVLRQERQKQRQELLAHPEKYLERLSKTKDFIQRSGKIEVLTQNAIHGLDELKEDFLTELLKNKQRKSFEITDR